MSDLGKWSVYCFAGFATLYGAWLYYQPKRALPPLRQTAKYACIDYCLSDANSLSFLLVDASPQFVDLSNRDPRCIGVLTHSRGNHVVESCKADLSTEICFLALEKPNMRATLVSCDHLDVDALCSIYVFSNPKSAIANQELLIEVARAGDFLHTTCQKAASICEVIESFIHKSRSPLPSDHPAWQSDFREKISILVPICLQILHELLENSSNLQKYEYLWATEFHSSKATEQAITDGLITFESIDDLDLTISICKTNFFPSIRSIYNHTQTKSNQIIIHLNQINSTNSFILYQRYESVVDYQSKKPKPVIDLTPLAQLLTQMETNKSNSWKYYNSKSWKLALKLSPNCTNTTLTSEQFCKTVISYLSKAY